jgi:hypothetical protein
MIEKEYLTDQYADIASICTNSNIGEKDIEGKRITTKKVVD